MGGVKVGGDDHGVEMRDRKRRKKDEGDKDKGEVEGPGYGRVEDQSLWTRCHLPIVGELRFNPVVSFFAIALIWSFATVCIIYKVSQWLLAATVTLLSLSLSLSLFHLSHSPFQEDVPFKLWRQWIVEKFTWLYIGSQDVWFLFLLVLYFRWESLHEGTYHFDPILTPSLIIISGVAVGVVLVVAMLVGD